MVADRGIPDNVLLRLPVRFRRAGSSFGVGFMGMNSWTVRGGKVVDPAPFCLIGILNVTPDSFSDGGSFLNRERAVQHGLELLDEGAGMLDIGAESTRPFAAPVGAEEETARLLPVLRSLREARPDAFISVDTFRARTARAALEAGADVINDVSACTWEPELLDVIAEYRPGYVLMHSQGNPQEMQVAPRYGNVVEDILAFFEQKLELLTAAGLPEDHIVLDPGVGFGKNREHTEALLQGIERFASLGRPLYVGLSRKSLFREILGLERVEERSEPTRLAVALLAARGIPYHRVHEVAGCARALQLVRAMTPGFSS